jgi:TolA-binding protein
LKANADTGSDLMSEKSRMNELAGRLDETTHKLDELQSTLAAARTELDARFDQLARAQAAQATPAPPPPSIPANKADHYAAIQAAFKAKDYVLVRALGHEYVNRYATDEKADEVLYLTGRADLDDGRPSSALGEFNRFLKLYPQSKMLDKTLFAMGQAYEALHDCANAKLAYGAVVTHFGHEKIGPGSSSARARNVAFLGGRATLATWRCVSSGSRPESSSCSRPSRAAALAPTPAEGSTVDTTVRAVPSQTPAPSRLRATDR